MVEQDVIDALKERGMQFYIRPTVEAVKKINELSQEGRRFAAILHAT